MKYILGFQYIKVLNLKGFLYEKIYSIQNFSFTLYCKKSDILKITLIEIGSYLETDNYCDVLLKKVV